MNVSNRKTIRRLSVKSMRASRSRNLIAVLAIALTTLMFTALFTIALSINYSYQQSNFRQVGGYSHGGFKYLSREQVEELRDHRLIKEYGLRLFVGMPKQEPFNKSQVEIGYSDANEAKWAYAVPVEGQLPQEGTKEAATDTRVLSLLGIEPQLGVPFTMTFDVDGQETTETFTLCGWWEHDPVVVASHVLLPQSRAEEIFEELNTQGADGMTGTWSLDVMFSTSWSIEKNLDTILLDYGYQSERRDHGEYIATGVNWGYTGAQAVSGIDPVTVIGIGLLLLIITFTGYLIIYNVFQISVANDIRFYGLLKAIGTTGRQIKRMIRLQALALSLVGIPLGLAGGYLVGARLAPLVLSRLNGVLPDAVSASPVIFILAAIFCLITIFISCRRPGKMAAKVSPVEAVRYTENGSTKSKNRGRKGQKGASLPKMAWANLGRAPRKTAITVISLSLAVVLLHVTTVFTSGFDMNKYLRNMAVDFIIADAGYFQVGNFWNRDMALPEEVINEILEEGGVQDGGRTYGLTSNVQEFVEEDYYRSVWGRYNTAEAVDFMVENGRREDGLIADNVQLFGMEEYVLGKLGVLEGDLAKVNEAGSRYVAAVYSQDDYSNARADSHWAGLGDVITLRYVEEFEYYDAETGEILDGIPEDGRPWASRATVYRDVEYEVAALVTMPAALTYRYYGSDEFILNAETFMADTGTGLVMYYAFDMEEGNEAALDAMESYLKAETSGRLSQYDYESKETYVKEFDAFRSMFMIFGGVLSLIIGIVGILNFVNAILTGILSRRREFAVLQSVGMTGRQLKKMLIWEGLYYTLGAASVSLTLAVAASPLVSTALTGMFWFFTYRFTVLPVLMVLPFFMLLGVLLPLITYYFTAKRSIVERLREAEA